MQSLHRPVVSVPAPLPGHTCCVPEGAAGGGGIGARGRRRACATSETDLRNI